MGRVKLVPSPSKSTNNQGVAAMKKTLLALAILSLASYVPLANAHARWLLPSQTNFSGAAPQWVNIDGSLSEDVFVAERPLGNSMPNANGSTEPAPTLVITLPSGQTDTSTKLLDLGRKSVLASQLTTNGTYRFSLLPADSYMGSFTAADGKPQRLRGTLAEIISKIPADAQNVKVSQTQSRIETYVSLNAPDTTALKSTGQGLELSTGSTHPNDLYVDEPSRFAFTVNCKPAPAGVKIKLTPEGTHFRNQRETQLLQTDKTGVVTVKWPKAGRYLLEAEATQAGKEQGVNEIRSILTLTLEVNNP
jgi:hypothetical protein